MDAFEHHDHSGCVADALSAVEARCAQDGLRLTPQRRQVLELLLREHRAMGAYDILERLNRDGARAQPPVAYRALDFLTRNGFAHRIERLNAFVACATPGGAHVPAFLICRACDAVAETRPETGPMDGAAARAGFEIENRVIEAEGLCPRCRPDAKGPNA